MSRPRAACTASATRRRFKVDAVVSRHPVFSNKSTFYGNQQLTLKCFYMLVLIIAYYILILDGISQHVNRLLSYSGLQTINKLTLLMQHAASRSWDLSSRNGVMTLLGRNVTSL